MPPRFASAVDWFRRLGPAGPLALFWSFAPPAGGFLLLYYANTVSGFLRDRGDPWGALLYTGVFILSAGLGLLPTYSQSVLAGWCFGLAEGFPAAWAGFAGASMVGYLVARGAARHRVEDLIQTNAKARAVHEALVGHGFWRTLGIVTLLRVPPNSPFALMNLAMSSTGVPPLAFLCGTALGMAPRTAAAVYIGSTLSAMTTESLEQAVPWWAKGIAIAVTIAILALVGWIASRAAARVAARPPAPGSAGRPRDDDHAAVAQP
jgi:uncharacterized membrane protein YdjX (TVP38/TMEM64 family)